MYQHVTAFTAKYAKYSKSMQIYAGPFRHIPSLGNAVELGPGNCRLLGVLLLLDDLLNVPCVFGTLGSTPMPSGSSGDFRSLQDLISI
jgi:hypothetical protein